MASLGRRGRGRFLPLLTFTLLLLGPVLPAAASGVTTTLRLSGRGGEDGWFQGPVTVTLSATATDARNLGTFFRLDGGGWQEYSRPFVIEGDGVRALEYNSTPSEGVEETRVAEVRIDATPPTIPAPGLAGTRRSASLFASPVTITLPPVADETSGEGPIRFRLLRNGVEALPWSDRAGEPVVASEDGTWALEYWGLDAAGNAVLAADGRPASDANPLLRSFVVDTTPPTLTLEPLLDPGGTGILAVRVASSEAGRTASALPSVTFNGEAPPVTLRSGVNQFLTLFPPLNAGDVEIRATFPDAARNSGVAAVTVTAPPREPLPGVRSLTTFPDPLEGGAEAAVEAVLDPAFEAGALSLEWRHVSNLGRASFGNLTATAETADGEGARTVWWNRSFGPGVLAYRVKIDRSGGESASPWEGALVADTLAPLLEAPRPADGSRLGGRRAVIGVHWSDESGLDPSRVHLRVNGAPKVSVALLPGRIEWVPGKDLAYGDYTVEVSVADRVGLTSEIAWTFTVGSASGPPTGPGSGPIVEPCESAQDAGGSTGAGSGCPEDSAPASTGTPARVPDDGATPDPPEPGGDGGRGEEPSTDRLPPILLSHGPTGVVTTDRPEIFATYADPDGEVVAGGVRIVVDDARLVLNATATEARGRPAAPLAEGIHRVQIILDDFAAHSVRFEWKLRVVAPAVPGSRVVAGPFEAAAGQGLRIPIADPAFPLREIHLFADGRVSNLTFASVASRVGPAEAPPPPVPALAFLAFETTADSRPRFDRAILRFALPKAAFDEARAEARQFVLLAADEGTWRPVVLSLGRQGPDEVEGSALLDGLRPLALGFDAEPPTAQLLAPKAGEIVAGAADVRVRASDNLPLPANGIALAVGDEPLLLTPGEGDAWSAKLGDLPDGRHTLRLQVRDAAGNEAESSLSLLVDRTRPQFPSVSPSGAVTERRPVIRVFHADPSGSGIDPATASVYLDGRDVTHLASRTPESVVVSPTEDLLPGDHTVEVRVSDRAGNEATLSHAFTVEGSNAVPGTPWVWALGIAAIAAGASRRRGA